MDLHMAWPVQRRIRLDTHLHQVFKYSFMDVAEKSHFDDHINKNPTFSCQFYASAKLHILYTFLDSRCFFY
jgi:hypothetical protein